MIPKASRKERSNMTAAASAESIVVYTVSTNRTFIMTDLVFTYNDDGAGITIYDSIVATATPTASTSKLKFYSNPVRMTGIENGPEFSLGVSVKMDDPNHGLPTYGFWCGGFER